MFKYLLYLIICLYAVLSIVAAGTQLRTAEKRDTPLLMIFGGILLLAAVGLELLALFDGWLITGIGGACICFAAFLNGRRSGSFHIKHHMIRFAVTLLLVIGFYIL